MLKKILFRSTLAFRSLPFNVLVNHFNWASLAMKTVLGINLKFLSTCFSVFNKLVNFSGTKSFYITNQYLYSGAAYRFKLYCGLVYLPGLITKWLGWSWSWFVPDLAKLSSKSNVNFLSFFGYSMGFYKL